MPKDTEDSDARNALSRRSLFKQLGLASAATAVSGTSLASGVAAPAAPVAPAPMPAGEALETLTAAEAEALEAIVSRLIPTDENGPGATEARAAPLHRPRSRRSACLFARGVRTGPRGG
jgi:hypothetical protein